MRKLYYLLFLLPVLALSQNQNYTKTTTYKVPTLDGVTATDGTGAVTSDKKTVNVMYFDGLGRQMQHVAHLQSGTGKNVITPIVYDASGMPTKQYMPLPSESTTIGYTENTSVLSSLQSYYTTNYGTDGQNPYIETKVEASPLRRVLKQAAPGMDWMMPVNVGDPDHTVRVDYMTNTATEVRRLTTTSSMASGIYSIAPITTSGQYPAGELVKTVVKDENWEGGNDHSVVEFRNKQGQVVLKRTYESGTEHDTYYVYDQYGNLTYVVPPMADSSNVTNDMLNGYCYQYKYDNRNRLVEKKLPGKDWEFIVYDKLNRIAATGPANSPFSDLSSQGWMIVKYDAFSRPVITGWMPAATITSATRKSLQQEADSQATMYTSETKIQSGGTVSVNGIALKYDNYSWPASATSYHVLTVRYYDDYNFPDAPTTFSVVIDLVEKAYYNNTDKLPKGLPTGSLVRVLTTTSSTDAEKSYVLYDEYGRPVRQFSRNHLGGHIQGDNKLDFAGKPIHIVTKHKRDSGATEITIKDAFGFTGQDRLLVHTHQIGAGTPQLMGRNEYNGLGQLISKFVGGTNLLGSNALQKIDYAYNIRGWLKEVNKVDGALGTDLFAYALNYNTVTNETTGVVSKKVKRLYNGNISEMIWKSATDSKKRRYGYKYDSMNRLTDAIYQNADMDTPQAPYAGVTNAYNEHVAYDKNGNIMYLQRNGNVDVADPLQAVAIDDLNYIYKPFSNQLASVEDLENEPKGFKDGNTNGNDYDHDGYGNIKYDLNKGISNITYNHLNLPKLITFATGDKIEYTYNAIGTRVGKKVTIGAAVTQFYYLNGFQYKGTDLEFFPTSEGYVDATAGAYKYVFNYRDHLGNVRLSYTKDGTNPIRVLDENHYYPFGMEHEGYNDLVFNYQVNGSGSAVLSVLRNKSQYKFNGQEYQDELGLNMTAMDYRQYDNALGRFHSMDALAELMPGINPYQFGFNNPVYWSDPSGLSPHEPPVNGDNPIELDPNGVVIKNNYKPKPKANSSSSFLETSFIPPFSAVSGMLGFIDGSSTMSGGGGSGRPQVAPVAIPTPVGLIPMGGVSPITAALMNGNYNSGIAAIGQQNPPGVAYGWFNSGMFWSPTFFGVPIRLFPGNGQSASYFGGAINMSHGLWKEYLSEGLDSSVGYLLMHEFGHSLQENYGGKGWYYGYTAGASLYSFTFDYDNHRNNWTEVQASTLAYYYFGKPIGFTRYYPINSSYISENYLNNLFNQWNNHPHR